MSDTPNAGKVRAEALRIAESEKPPTSHAVYPTKAVLEGESRRRAVFQYAEGIARGRTVTAEQVEAAVASMREQSPDNAPDWLDWVWHRYVRAAFRAAGFYVPEPPPLPEGNNF